MTLNSVYIELFIGGKSPGEMSGGKCPDTNKTSAFLDGTRRYGVPAPFLSYEKYKLIFLTMLYNF